MDCSPKKLAERPIYDELAIRVVENGWEVSAIIRDSFETRNVHVFTDTKALGKHLIKWAEEALKARIDNRKKRV
jgi:hypothetical protein